MGLFFKRKPGNQQLRVERTEFLDKYTVEIQRRSRRRQTTLTVAPRGEIVVKCALTTPQRAIEELLLTHEEWLRKNLQRALEHRKRFPLKQFVEGESYPLRGQSLSLRICKSQGRRWRVHVMGPELVAEVPCNFKELYTSAEALRKEGQMQVAKFYRRHGVKVLGERLKSWAEHTGLQPRKVSFRSQRTMWGSCSSRGDISLNWKMIAFPEPIYDYILVHELCHIQHPNHSKRFWSLVESFLPDYKDRRTWLQEHQNLVDFLSR